MPLAFWRGLEKGGALLALIMSLGAAGCGSSSGTVTGKVTYNGTALKGGRVTFIPQAKDKIPVGADIGEDGAYTVDRVPTGLVKIAVDTSTFKPPTRKIPINKPPKDVKAPEGYKPPNFEERAKRYTPIPEKYTDPNKSGLDYTVTSGSQTHDIPLTGPAVKQKK